MPNSRTKRGFTLIEIIVALMIFSIVVVVALAALVKIIDANKKAQTTQDAVIGLSFALESMSRELRTGSKVHCETTWSGSFDPTIPANQIAKWCPLSVGHNQLIVFQSTKTYPAVNPTCRLAYAYLFTGSAGAYVLQKAEQPDCAHVFVADDFSPVIPSTVTLTDYNVGETYHITAVPFPRVYVELSGFAGAAEKNKTYFTIQTLSASRTP